MKKQLLSLMMPLLPKGELSRHVGRLVHTPLPGPLGRKSVELFARYYRIDMSEAEYPLEHYRTIGDLFTRRLKPGARPIGSGLVHPADSVITEAGSVEKLQLIQAKGQTYSLPEFLRSQHWAQVFEGGTFFTYYLCPTDYHRVHSPVTGDVVWSCHVPGELWPVNEWSVGAIENLFSVNERVIAILQTEQGRVAVVMVAATNVGDIGVSFDESISTTSRADERAARERSYDPPKPLEKGQEFGVFRMGSTVIVLYEQGMVAPTLCEKLRGRRVKVGQS
ncbi:MAG: archaetidylserine decarboxylase, partial [Bdellovibrionaceae bacterium]|nr:archaetidylserine decarboxylase [Pseudobdellovibrionaceae bacterium]